MPYKKMIDDVIAKAGQNTLNSKFDQFFDKDLLNEFHIQFHESNDGSDDPKQEFYVQLIAIGMLCDRYGDTIFDDDKSVSLIKGQLAMMMDIFLESYQENKT